MHTQRVASTPKSQIQSLSCQGIRVGDSYHQITELVRARLGNEYALLFAEPSLAANGKTIDWYTPLQGAPLRIIDLGQNEAEELAARAANMGQAIKKLAEELKSLGGETNMLRGAMLELAVNYAADSCIYSVNGNPVLTCWGYTLSGQGAQPEDLARFGNAKNLRRATPPAEETKDVPPPARHGIGGLGWLIPLILLLLLLAAIFIPFGQYAPLLPWLSGVPDKADVTDGREKLRFEEQRLQAEITDLRARLDERAALCKPVTPQTPPPPQTQVTPDAQKSEKPQQDMAIPKDSDDLAFLKGKWKSDSGLINTNTKQAVIIFYEFDNTGNGTAKIIEQKDNDICTGKARASFSGRRTLIISSDRLPCRNAKNQAYQPMTVECALTDDGKTSCFGKNADGTLWNNNVYFYRIP
ncbi:MAG: hypothetical protein LBB60_12365 [Desulfovibrio sp.]|nr:hypothetical protein [Desulfovibrio sp.]